MPNPRPRSYCIGTRGSLLALTQTTLIKQELEQLTGDQFHLKVISTQGDQQTDKPLWQMEGKNFFTKEIDEALLRGEIDLSVHSLKDLGESRPEGTIVAAMTKRQMANDILFLKKSTLQKKLNSWNIGTSSPRRQAQIGQSLRPILGKFSPEKIQCSNLRGNVNTRLKKLQDNQYEAIVLALAGIERLASSQNSRSELRPLIEGLTFMVLPLSNFPPAQAQGSLGIECLNASLRNDDGELEKKIHLLHHQKTAVAIKTERAKFSSYGGGCHLAVGIYARELGENRQYFVEKGIHQEKKVLVEKVSCPKRHLVKIKKPFFETEKFIRKIPNSLSNDEKIKIDGSHLFVTSSHTIHALSPQTLESQDCSLLWVSGVKTWQKLTEKGYFVQGCCDGLGHDELESFKKTHFFTHFFSQNKDWSVFSHQEANSLIGTIIKTYAHQFDQEKFESENIKKEFESSTLFYWHSIKHFHFFLQIFPWLKEKTNPQGQDIWHCCGLGKTYQGFIDQNMTNFLPFATFEEFQKFSL